MSGNGTIHYKFGSLASSTSVSFPGSFISLAELKRAIIEDANLGASMDFDLVITNAQSNEGGDTRDDVGCADRRPPGLTRERECGRGGGGERG